MKKIFLTVFVSVFIFMFSSVAYAGEDDFDAFNDFKAYVLMDSASGQIVAEKNSTELYQDTGLSQLMSLYIIFDSINNGSLKYDDEIIISDKAADAIGPQMFLDRNSSYTVDELLCGLAMVAASDAAYALCEEISGDAASFINMMNSEALLMGMNDTVYNSIDGYATKGEKTTAKDVACLASRMCENADIFKYTSLWQYTLIHDSGRTTDIVNANRIIKANDLYDGLGVGSGSDCGYSIVATSNAGDSRFIFVGIGAESSKARFEATEKILDYAKKAYTTKTFVNEGQIVKKDFTVEGGPKKEFVLCAEEDISLLLKIGEEDKCKKEFILYDEITLPLNKGDEVGEIIISLGGSKIGSAKVLVTEDILPLTFESSFYKILGCWLG